jgi:tRNA-2-methylthio-N6-dimethylallyladenosine synthase
MRVAESSRFAAAYTFQYSIRPGTPAATMPNQVPKEVVQERFERLIARLNHVALKENEAMIGSRVEVLVANEGRKDAATLRMSGRSRCNRLVHFTVPEGALAPRPGDIVEVNVTEAAPYHLIADPAGVEEYSMRRTRAGDAWDRAEAASCGVPPVAPSGKKVLSLTPKTTPIDFELDD